MRTPVTENNSKEYEVSKKIKEMWGRIDEAAYAQNTSIGAVARAEGISGSAMYTAIRKAKKNGQYIDSSFPCIVTLVRGLNLDLDYVLTGEGSGNDETDILEVTEGLSYEDLDTLKRIAVGMALGVINGI